MDKPLTPTERKELKDLNISMTQLNQRYSAAKKRARYRKQEILPRYSFYRNFITQLKQAATKLNSTPAELFPLIDVHADPDYMNFKLLLRPNHKIVHSEQYHKAAKEILSKQRAVCNHCGEERPLTDFIRDRRTLTGYILTCKKCFKAMREERKTLEEVA